MQKKKQNAIQTSIRKKEKKCKKKANSNPNLN